MFFTKKDDYPPFVVKFRQSHAPLDACHNQQSVPPPEVPVIVYQACEGYFKSSYLRKIIKKIMWPVRCNYDFSLTFVCTLNSYFHFLF